MIKHMKTAIPKITDVTNMLLSMVIKYYSAIKSGALDRVNIMALVVSRLITKLLRMRQYEKQWKNRALSSQNAIR